MMSWAGSGRDLLRALFPVVAFWTYSALLSIAEWGHGVERSMALLVGAIGVSLLPSQRLSANPRTNTLLFVIAAILFALRAMQGVSAYSSGAGPAIDVGQTTVAAVELQLEGQNPYTTDIDPIARSVDPTGTGFRFFGGFKYGPAMTWAYTPAVAAFGASGFFLTNLIFLAAAAVAGGYWALVAAGRGAAVGAFALVLTPAFIHHELFVAGINDIVPVAMLVAAFALRARGSGVAAGAVLGLSLGAKLLPASLLALPLLFVSGTRRLSFAVSAGVVALLAYVPAAIRSPKELLAGLVVFNLERPVDSTSVLHFVPEPLVVPLRISALAVAVMVGFALVRHAASRFKVAAYSSLLLSVFFFASPAVHRNWLFWVLPILSVAIAIAIWGQASDRGERGRWRGGSMSRAVAELA